MASRKLKEDFIMNPTNSTPQITDDQSVNNKEISQKTLKLLVQASRVAVWALAALSLYGAFITCKAFSRGSLGAGLGFGAATLLGTGLFLDTRNIESPLSVVLLSMKFQDVTSTDRHIHYIRNTRIIGPLLNFVTRGYFDRI